LDHARVFGNEGMKNNLKLVESLRKFEGKKVLVVGDVMLDQYSYGSIERMSPEAPVAVLNKSSESYVPGGAANVACNLVALGAKVSLCGVIGKDENGDRLVDILKKKGVDTKLIVTDTSRQTTLKHRVVAGNQQMLRIDDESVVRIDRAIEKKVLAKLKPIAPKQDGVILSDYAKGFFTEAVVKLFTGKRRTGVVVADIKPVNKHMFIGVDVLTPNLKEAREMSGLNGIEEIGKSLRNYFGANVVVTRGGDGMSVFPKGGKHIHVPTKKVRIFDVSGAGDTAVSVMTMGLVGGLDLVGACKLANIAASVVVQDPGTSTITIEELESHIDGLANHISGVKKVDKVWGYEKWIENNEKYCSKLLVLNKGYQCSMHYHKNKDEVFLVLSGHVRLELDGKVIHMREGNFQRVMPGQKHRFRGVEDSEILEVSTHHDDVDSYRLEESRRV